MDGRLQILVLVVAIVVRPSMQINNVLEAVAQRCQNTVGQQAAADLRNLKQQILVCTKFQELRSELMTVMRTNGLKEAIETICQRKRELLTCSDQAFATFKNCLNEVEKEVLTSLQKIMEPTMDFVCEHEDEIVAISGSQEEIACLKSLSARAETCKPYTSQGAETLLNSLKSQEQKCKDLDGMTDCLNGITGSCKDSDSLRFYNELKSEVIDDAICSKNGQHNSASAVLPRVGTCLELLRHFVLALTLPYILCL